MRAIFCGNLEYDARQSEVERLFKKYGRVERVDMKSGFAFVYMEDEKDADDAIRRLDRAEFGRKGRRLRVEWTKQERDSRRPGGGGARKPAANDKPSKTLFVINFDPIYTKSKDLERHFDQHGKIANIRIRRNFAFIQYETLEDATRALEATNMSKLMDRVITVEYAIRDDDRSNGHSPDRRGRDLSPDRGSYRRRSPSPYRRERGSPDYGYRRDRGSPDYGNGGRSGARGSPEYSRDESPANGRYHSRSRPDARGSPVGSPANERYHSRSRPEARGTPEYAKDESPANERYHSRSRPETQGSPDYVNGDSGIAFIVSGATANMSLDWYYSYSSGWFFPLQFSDHGFASIQVEGMQVGLTFYLEIQEGRLKLSPVECGCFVEDLSIKLDGGASWLYQGLVDVFAGQIESAVEEAITKNLNEAILKLALSLESLPKQIPVDDVASLNVTFVNDLLLSNSSIGFEINGLFTRRDQTLEYKYKDHLFHKEGSFSPTDQKWKSNFYEEHVQALSCRDSSRMVGISIDEAIFHSASNLYFEAGYLKWIVDKIPDQALLNTAGWRFIIPQLYKKYPKDDMNLNVSFVSPPIVRISPQNIDIIANVDLIIDVLEGGQVIPVACILLEIHASGFVRIRGNDLGGKVKVDDFKMALKWSKIGNLKMFLIQPVIRTVVETVFVPYANARLWKGFTLPMFHGFTLEKAITNYLDSSLVVCSDVAYSESDDHVRL